jgi:hypothetical protein
MTTKSTGYAQAGVRPPTSPGTHTVGVIAGFDNSFGIVTTVLGVVLLLNGIFWAVRLGRKAQPAKRHSRTIPQDVKIAVTMRDQGRCRHCGSNANLHYDHIQPFSRGGAATPPATSSCSAGGATRERGAVRRLIRRRRPGEVSSLAENRTRTRL